MFETTNQEIFYIYKDLWCFISPEVWKETDLAGWIDAFHPSPSRAEPLEAGSCAPPAFYTFQCDIMRKYPLINIHSLLLKMAQSK